MMGSIGFGLAAACAVVSAIAVVRSADLVRAVLWLALALLATAILYAAMGASFLAALQVLVYVGGVVTLMVFGVMITRRHDGIVVPAERARTWPAALVSGGLFALVTVAVETTPGLDSSPSPPSPLGTTELGRLLLREHVFAFEIVSMLLLGAMIGAIVLARRRDPGPDDEVTRRARARVAGEVVR